MSSSFSALDLVGCGISLSFSHAHYSWPTVSIDLFPTWLMHEIVVAFIDKQTPLLENKPPFMVKQATM
jgi:hypothetical protein